MRPDRVGPIAGATAMTMLTLPITTPRRWIGTSVRIVVISSGSMIAVPDAWTIRPSSSTQKPGASPASRVPALNRPSAAPYTVRVENRCSRKPVVGMTTAMVSMKAVVSHCTVPAVRSRSTISTGSATPMIVSLRMTTKVATSSVAMTLRSRLRSWVSATSVVVMVGAPVRRSGAANRPARKSVGLVSCDCPAGRTHRPG